MNINNFSDMYSTKQIEQIIQLLPKNYYQNLHLCIYKNIFNYIFNTKCLSIDNIFCTNLGKYIRFIKKDINYIEIFEYLINKKFKNNKNIYFVFVLFHEYRHNYITNKYKLNKKKLKKLNIQRFEDDANIFASKYIDLKSKELCEILNLKYLIFTNHIKYKYKLIEDI